MCSHLYMTSHDALSLAKDLDATPDFSGYGDASRYDLHSCTNLAVKVVLNTGSIISSEHVSITGDKMTIEVRILDVKSIEPVPISKRA
jgi:hypothetical protein